MKHPTDESLKQYSKAALAPTIEMLFATAFELYRDENDVRPHIKQALMDSFRIHARSLLYFFYADQPRADDAKAQSFMQASIEWSKVRRNQTPALIDLQRRVGKEVAHLTYSRPTDTETVIDWNIGTEMKDLYLVFQDFFKHADNTKLHDKIAEVPLRWLAEFRRHDKL